MRRKKTAQEDSKKLRQEVLRNTISQQKNSPDPDYGDQFNRRVCQKLDQLETQNANVPKDGRLGFAQKVVEKEIASEITSQTIEDYLAGKIRLQYLNRLQPMLSRGLELLGNSDKALKFAGLMFEIEQRKTDNVWQQRKFEEIIAAGLRGEPINLITMLCCINKFDFVGGYTLVPDLWAFKQNPKLEPVPLIAEELVAIASLFEYYGLQVNLTLYVSDTDYTEIGQFGTVTDKNLENLNQYLASLRIFAENLRPGTKVLPISSSINGNPAYEEVKKRVLKKVTSFKDEDFSREWYRKFEDAVERVSESQGKRKLFAKGDIRRKSLEITRMIWAVNAAQGAVFGLLSPNTILLSTERRERDQNYAIDAQARKTLPPVLYVLRAAERWNRKLTGREQKDD